MEKELSRILSIENTRKNIDPNSIIKSLEEGKILLDIKKLDDLHQIAERLIILLLSFFIYKNLNLKKSKKDWITCKMYLMF